MTMKSSGSELQRRSKQQTLLSPTAPRPLPPLAATAQPAKSEKVCGSLGVGFKITSLPLPAAWVLLVYADRDGTRRRWRFVLERLRMWLRCQCCVCVESLLGTLRIRTAPQREGLGTQDPCRGFGGHFSNSHGVTARAL